MESPFAQKILRPYAWFCICMFLFHQYLGIYLVGKILPMYWHVLNFKFIKYHILLNHMSQVRIFFEVNCTILVNVFWWEIILCLRSVWMIERYIINSMSSKYDWMEPIYNEWMKGIYVTLKKDGCARSIYIFNESLMLLSFIVWWCWSSCDYKIPKQKD